MKAWLGLWFSDRRDKALEKKITSAVRALVDAETLATRRPALDRLRLLVGQRSPRQVARMERARGLRA